MKHLICALSLILFSLATSSAHADNCMEANASDQIAEGRLALGQFKDAADRTETAYILLLPAPTCLSAEDPDERVESTDKIHIFSSDDAIQGTLKSFVGKTVLVRGTALPAHTVHHHAPILIDVSEIDQQ